MRIRSLGIAVLAATCLHAQGAGDPGLPRPTADNLAAWRDHLLPAADELRWQEIPWLPTFADGLRAASAQHRPLLLWVMNGHPLGCT